MKRSTFAIIEEYRNVLNGYVSLFSYRLANLCIKADPVSLLGVTVVDDGLNKNIENVALVGKGEDKYKINVYPKDEKQILLVGKGIAEEHPEFKQEMETMTTPDGIEIRYIKLTMPEVNDDREKVMTDAVKTLHDECVAKLKAGNAFYMGKLTIDQAGASKEDIDEAKQKFDEMTDMYNKTCEDIAAEKTKEIEDAYQAYLEKKQKEEEEKAETDAATGKDAMNKLKL